MVQSALAATAPESQPVRRSRSRVARRPVVRPPVASVPREIKGILRGAPFNWVGDGFRVSNYFPNGNRIIASVSPFLLLDYGAPYHFAPTNQRRGVGAHPHRGFETVTIAYRGAVAHHDSAGNGGVIQPGDVQWMTAGRGVLHNEYHDAAFARSGGDFHMVQLWVNLPAADKMTAPRYQALTADRIPEVALPNGAGRARVIAGAFAGATGPAATFTPVELVDLRLAGGGAHAFSLPAGHNAALLVQEGSLAVNGRAAAAGELVLFGDAGQEIALEAGGDGAMALLMAGEPIPDPVVFYGPFVMTSREEIEQAIADFHRGQFGRLED